MPVQHAATPNNYNEEKQNKKHNCNPQTGRKNAVLCYRDCYPAWTAPQNIQSNFYHFLLSAPV